MNGISFRDVTVEDSAMIADLFARSFVETFGHLYLQKDLQTFLDGITPESFAEQIADPEFALRVAETAEEPVGFAKIGPPSLPIETPPNTAELWQIYVLKPWQGQGIAEQLYQWALGAARRRGTEHLQLSVYVANMRARRFYDLRGFEVVGRYDFMVGDHADEDLVMRRPI